MTQHITIDANTETFYLLSDSNHNIHFEQQEGSVLNILLLALTDEDANIRLRIDHVAERCQTYIRGVILTQGTQKVNISTDINHLKGNGKSDQLIKCILADKSECSFSGLLKICKDSQQVEARQTNRNILLSTKAKMRTMPQLEIYADDVKASHGATTGQLDESTLFYMQQRGIAPETGRMLLLKAFAADIIDSHCAEKMQEQITSDIYKRIATILHSSEND